MGPSPALGREPAPRALADLGWAARGAPTAAGELGDHRVVHSADGPAQRVDVAAHAVDVAAHAVFLHGSAQGGDRLGPSHQVERESPCGRRARLPARRLRRTLHRVRIRPGHPRRVPRFPAILAPLPPALDGAPAVDTPPQSTHRRSRHPQAGPPSPRPSLSGNPRTTAAGPRRRPRNRRTAAPPASPQPPPQAGPPSPSELAPGQPLSAPPPPRASPPRSGAP